MRKVRMLWTSQGQVAPLPPTSASPRDRQGQPRRVAVRVSRGPRLHPDIEGFSAAHLQGEVDRAGSIREAEVARLCGPLGRSTRRSRHRTPHRPRQDRSLRWARRMGRARRRSPPRSRSGCVPTARRSARHRRAQSQRRDPHGRDRSRRRAHRRRTRRSGRSALGHGLPPTRGGSSRSTGCRTNPCLDCSGSGTRGTRGPRPS